MRKNTRKILTLGVFGLFMLMFAMQFVVADVVENVENPIKDWFTKWEGGEDFSANIAKYLFWALVSMLIYSVGSKIPIMSSMFTEGKEFLGMTFSVIVGFLAMAYITPDEVYAMMMSYSAMGFVLGGAIPFIILVAFTFTLATDNTGGVNQQLANKYIAWVMWAGFVIFIIYKISSGGGGVSATANVFQWVIMGIAILFLVLMGSIFKILKGQKTKAQIDTAKEKIQKAGEHTKATAEQVDNLGREKQL